MKKLQVAVMSLCILCCLGWTLNGLAAKYDPLVEKAQKRLTELGYDVGTADGKMGQKTVEAIKKLQQDQGLTVTGKLDEETIKKLGISEVKPQPTSNPQLSKENEKQGVWLVKDVKATIPSTPYYEDKTIVVTFRGEKTYPDKIVPDEGNRIIIVTFQQYFGHILSTTVIIGKSRR